MNYSSSKSAKIVLVYLDSWISRPFWLGKYPDTKKLKYPFMQLSKKVEVSKYLCKYPNTSIQIQVSGYLPIGYQWKTINYLDNTWIPMDWIM